MPIDEEIKNRVVKIFSLMDPHIRYQLFHPTKRQFFDFYPTRPTKTTETAYRSYKNGSPPTKRSNTPT